MSGRRAGAGRRGTAIVELALALPVLVTIIFFAMEMSSVMYALQAVQATSHECARVASKRSGTDALVQNVGTSLLTQRGIRNATIQTNPASVNNLTRGQRIVVTVNAPFAQNSWFPRWFFTQRNMTGQCTVVKQF